MHKIKPYLLNLIFTIPVIIFTLYSCATKPNIPYPGRMSENFAKLEQWNPLLASEIRKLPEFQNGVAVQEEKALDDLVELYASNSKAFSNAFKQMYQVGIPEVRKYCSPLQALYWLFEDGKTGWAKKAVANFTANNDTKKNLYDLLDNSWASFKNEFALEWYWRVEEAIKLEASCTDPDIIRKIQRHKEENLGPKGLTDYAIQVAKEHPKVFTYKFDPSQFEDYKQKQIERWNDFNTVIERLNAPESVDKYQKLNFIYNLHFRKTATARSMFKKKVGNCYAHAVFATYALKKAGYEANTLRVRKLSTDVYLHRTAWYKDVDGYYYVLDNAWKMKVHGIHGPFKSKADIRQWFEIATSVEMPTKK